MHRIFIAVVVALLAAGPVAATDTTDITSLLETWVSSFNKGDLQAMAARCTEQSAIIDNFPPHEWHGTAACGRWATDFQNFAKEGGITAPIVTLGKPLHLDLSTDRAYVVVPATFSYRQKGKAVLENAIATFALQKYTAGWYIAGWAWADHQALPLAKLFVISAPSGAGKTSLVSSLLSARPGLTVSVSHTTRKPRATEVEGRDYHFVTPAQFLQLIDQNAFLEHAQVFDNFYGTGAEQVRAKLAAGSDVLLEIDWQGARQVRRAMPDSTSIFILPPSRAALEQRLRERRTDSAETIARRLADASADMSHYDEFDYVVVNDQFERAAAELGAILDGGGGELRANRPELKPLIATLVRAA